MWIQFFPTELHRNSIHIPQPLWKMSDTLIYTSLPGAKPRGNLLIQKGTDSHGQQVALGMTWKRQIPTGVNALGISKTGIDICGNVPNVVLQIGIPGGQSLLYLLDGIKNGGVVFIQLLADVGCTGSHLTFNGIRIIEFFAKDRHIYAPSLTLLI